MNCFTTVRKCAPVLVLAGVVLLTSQTASRTFGLRVSDGSPDVAGFDQSTAAGDRGAPAKSSSTETPANAPSRNDLSLTRVKPQLTSAADSQAEAPARLPSLRRIVPGPIPVNKGRGEAAQHALPGLRDGACSAGGCTSPTFQWPNTLFDNPSSNWTVFEACAYAGEHSRFWVNQGSTYEWSACSADGAICPWDSEFMLRDTLGNNLCYNDDWCGLQSKIRWTATFTGEVHLARTLYPCLSNTTCAILVWRLAAANVCGPGNGDCCAANGTPGCDDTACCQSVCAADPFCCGTNWDVACRTRASIDPNCGCCSDAIPAAAQPLDQSTLCRTANNTSRLTFEGADISAPAPGQIMIQELLPGGGYGDDLSAFFDLSVEVDSNGLPRVLRIRQIGTNGLADRTWYAIRTTCGSWPGVSEFKVQYCVLMGDVNNDCLVQNLDAGECFPRVSFMPVPDDDRCDVNGDGYVQNLDAGAIFPRISFVRCPDKPDGH